MYILCFANTFISQIDPKSPLQISHLIWIGLFLKSTYEEQIEGYIIDSFCSVHHSGGTEFREVEKGHDVTYRMKTTMTPVTAKSSSIWDLNTTEHGANIVQNKYINTYMDRSYVHTHTVS